MHRCFLQRVVLAAAIVLAGSGAAVAHPLHQGSMDVTVYPDHVAVRARITVEEVILTTMVADEGTAAQPGTPPLTQAANFYGKYLATHLSIAADSKQLTGSVVSAVPPAAGMDLSTPLAQQSQHVMYELVYCSGGGAGGGGDGVGAAEMQPPAGVRLHNGVLVGETFLPGMSWETSYVVTIRTAGGAAAEGLLLGSGGSLDYACHWGAAAAGEAASTRRLRLLGDYLGHGIMHILNGWDHLLFVSALVLAAVTVWDLVKVVSAFTLAHTLTLTLSALDVVRLPSSIVEPLIAASIVFVAVQNIFWPGRSRGWARLAAAFFFGLFHGLGFAGGLLDAMGAMHGTTIVIAIIAFSLGVEVGHQFVVLPLFGALRFLRHAQKEAPARDRVALLAQRYGSVVISACGMFYFIVALRSAFLVSGAGASMG